MVARCAGGKLDKGLRSRDSASPNRLGVKRPVGARGV